MAEEPIVLVDAENVRRSQWPNVTGANLLERLCAWTAANRATALVVFDGKAPDGREDEHEVDDRVIVAGSGDESADDWIARRATELEEQGRRFWLVTSDRELRARAGDHAERTVGGGAFLREL